MVAEETFVNGARNAGLLEDFVARGQLVEIIFLAFDSFATMLHPSLGKLLQPQVRGSHGLPCTVSGSVPVVSIAVRGDLDYLDSAFHR